MQYTERMKKESMKERLLRDKLKQIEPGYILVNKNNGDKLVVYSVSVEALLTFNMSNVDSIIVLGDNGSQKSQHGYIMNDWLKYYDIYSKDEWILLLNGKDQKKK